MTTTRKRYSPKFKAKVALEAIRGERTFTQLASQYHVHPIQVGQWRKTAQEQLAELLERGPSPSGGKWNGKRTEENGKKNGKNENEKRKRKEGHPPPGPIGADAFEEMT